jgi:hypothetical protein
MLFDTPVNSFSLDASRSLGSEDGDSLTVEGWLNGAMVETLSLNFSSIDDWSTFALTSTVDEVRLLGAGAGFHPFGVDNVQWSPIPEPTSTAIIAVGLVALITARRRNH